MLKILQIIPNLRKGGAERLVLDICNELQKRSDIQIKLITFSDANEYKTQTDNIDWTVIPSKVTPSIKGKPLIKIQPLQNFIFDYCPDIIHTHLWESEIVLSKIEAPQAKWFGHFHSSMSQLKNLIIPTSKKDLTDFYEKRLITKHYFNVKKEFICISKETYNYALNVLPNSFKNNISLVSNGINYSRFNLPKVTDKHKILKLINVGTFVIKKNQKLAIDIVSQIIKNGIDTEITFLGDGSTKNDLMNYAKSLNIGDKVHFKGKVNNVEDFLNESSIYLHTALSEPFGLVLVEAMASGLPVISLDGGGNKDLIVNGKNGYLIQENEPNIFTEKITELWNNKSLLKQQSVYAKEFSKKFDIKQYCDKLIQLYTEVENIT